MPRRIGLLTALALAASHIVLGCTAVSSGAMNRSGSIARSIAISMEPAGSTQNTSDFFEVLLKWTPSGADPHVREWLEGQGLTAMSMKAGMLTMASPGQIEKSFGVSVEGVQPPLELPVPEELRSSVSSITVLKPRSYH